METKSTYWSRENEREGERGEEREGGKDGVERDQKKWGWRVGCKIVTDLPIKVYVL